MKLVPEPHPFYGRRVFVAASDGTVTVAWTTSAPS